MLYCDYIAGTERLAMVITFAGFTLRVEERLLSGPGGAVDIGVRAIDVLRVLLARPSEVVSKDELLSTVWPDAVVEENALQAQISALRKVLGASMIATVHGRGYRYAGGVPLSMDAGTANSAPQDRKPVVAVLPFANLSDDPEQRYFSDGITEDIIDRLSRFRMIAVIGSHSTFAIAGNAAGLAQVREKFVADYAVTGNVRRYGGHIRIAARLTDTLHGTVLWAEHYDRPVAELFGINDELASVIAGMLTRHVEVDVGSRPPLRDVSSYEVAMMGMMHFRAYTPEGNDRAASYFRRALEIDSRCTEALRGLSAYHIVMWLIQGAKEDLTRALDFALRGIETDPSNAGCHSNVGLVRLWAEGVDAARPAFQRAIEINPGDSYVLADASVGAVYDGDLITARGLLEKACRLNPIAPPWFAEYRGLLEFAEGRYEGSIRAFGDLRNRRYNMAYVVASYGHIGDGALLPVLLSRVRESGWNLSDFAATEPFRQAYLREQLLEGIAKAYALAGQSAPAQPHGNSAVTPRLE